MRATRYFFCFFVILLALPLFATDSYERELASALVKHVLVLRNFYTDSHLAYGNDGNLVPMAKHGFGPNEGRLWVQEVKLEPARLTITGSRPLPVFDEKSERLQLVDVHQTVTIQVELPASEDPRQSVPGLLKRVFLTSQETAHLECSAEETTAFVTEVKDAIRNTYITRAPEKTKTSPEPDAKDLGELKQECYPMGDRAYRISRGVVPIKALKTPDPPYPPSASRAGRMGTVLVMMIVDIDGTPTSLILARPLAPDFAEVTLKALRQWRFAPATFKGTPIPTAIHVEVNFSLER